MKRHFRVSVFIGLVTIATVADGSGMAQSERQVKCNITQIDSGTAWVSPYWGYNAPKLIFDGNAFYTIGMWGAQQATCTGVIYKLQGNAWVRGRQLEGLNYQPGMLLLDSQKRLIVIHAKMHAKPVILRSKAPGDIDNFETLPVPDGIESAGYLGAAIYGDKLTIGYIGAPKTYSFNLAVMNLATQQWSGPYVLAPEQRQAEPYTTWLYPIIQPDAHGIHMVVSNNKDATNRYASILYMYLPYDKLDQPPELEKLVDLVPWTGKMVFGMAMCRATDGGVYVTVLHDGDEKPKAIRIYRRDGRTGKWSYAELPEAYGMAAVYENPHSPGPLWLVARQSDALGLYRSNDHGGTWRPVKANVSLSGGQGRAWFMHMISPSSGSVMPDAPCAVFSTTPMPESAPAAAKAGVAVPASVPKSANTQTIWFLSVRP